MIESIPRFPAKSSQRRSALEQIGPQSLYLNAVQAAIIGTDLSGVVTYWNRFAEGLYGWAAAEVIGRNIMEVTVSSETEDEARKHMASVLAGNSCAGEFRVRCKDGNFVSAFLTLSPVLDEGATAVGVSQDLRSLKEAEGALPGEWREVSGICEFAAGIVPDDRRRWRDPVAE
jgi:PAS domain S-box-containing protein